ncbi:ribulose-phosphate 3-epimerase, partial [bacterium]|nr:ribulose-phosphate 3-epimerase [bacterium]
TNADFIHLDIMDGKFVPNKTWTSSEIKKITDKTTKKLDVHLMVNDPLKYIEDYAMLNTEYFVFHIESVKDINFSINKVKELGLKPGLAVKPETNINDIIPYLKDIKQVLVMSVEPGKSGQKFMESILYKIEALRKIIDEKNYDVMINVDGGINNETVTEVKEKGADCVVSASYLQEGNMQEKIDTLR